MKRRAAFTLFEVMLTVAITATVFAMIGGILISVITTTQNVEEMLKSEKAGYGVLDTLRSDLTGVYAYGLGGVAFKGVDNQELGREADSLHFVTTSDAMVNEDGTTPRLIEIGYRIAPDDDGKLLVLYRRTVPLDGDPVQSDEEYVELYGEMHSLNFEYLKGEGEWVEEWEEEDSIPKAVKIKIELALSEAERQIAEQGGGGFEVENPSFEMIVGIATTAGPPEAEQSE